MSEHEGGESKSVGAFLLGFLTGVLVCLGAGGALFLVQGRTAMEQARRAEMEARAAQEEAMMAREQAEHNARLAEKALKDAKSAKEKK